MVDLTPYPVLTRTTEEQLNSRQLLDYRLERENCLTWLLTRGKNPDEVVGYAEETVKSRAYRMDRFYRFVWEYEGGYTINVTHDHANAWMDHLAERDDVGQSHKRSCVKALKMLFKWRHHVHGLAEWEPEFTFSREPANQPRDFLTREERRTIRSAALEYGAVPDFNNLTPTERDRWKAYLAQRYEKPKSEVTPDDWDRANGWKIPSLVWTSLDTGLRPIEVERAVASWVDTDNDVLRIPKEMSSKTREHWVVGLTKRTSDALERWLKERKNYEMYDDTQALWLTRQANPYTAAPLRRGPTRRSFAGSSSSAWAVNRLPTSSDLTRGLRFTSPLRSDRSRSARRPWRWRPRPSRFSRNRARRWRTRTRCPRALRVGGPTFRGRDRRARR